MAELSQGDAVAIVIGALEPAERAGGVAYLCVTPFTAGQALDVPLALPHEWGQPHDRLR